MIDPRSISAPWNSTLTSAEHSLVIFFLGIAGLALAAGFVRTWVTSGEVGARFRAAIVARLGVMGISAFAYLFILVMFLLGYDPTSTGWVPNELAINSTIGRYMEWSLTVPLLVAELLSMTTLIGAAVRRTMLVSMGSAFLMIFAGFLGAVILGDGETPSITLTWFLVGSLFWILTNVVLIRAVRNSLADLTPEAARLLKSATLLLLGGWIIYPLVSLIQVVASGGQWTTTMLVAFSVADIVVKVGFGGLIQRVAKLRTAEDVSAGTDIHPEAIWISSVKQSDAARPREAYLAETATVHPTRRRPAGTWAVPVPRSEVPDDDDDATSDT